ncbi:MAG: SGNH/GDSL hydrolase family protein [Actinomycetota bacterium]
MSTQTKPTGDHRRAKGRMLPKIALALVTTVITLGAGELSLRAAPTPTLYMNMRDVVQQRCTRPHDTIQYVNRENYSGDFNNREFRTKIRINSKGLRDREFPYEKPAGVTRILALGDSFTFGWGVEAEETAAKVIERSLTGVEVLNAGCSGWGSVQELGFLKEEGVRYDPDVVLVFYSENDSIDNFSRYEFHDGRLMNAGSSYTPRANLERFLSRRSALWNLISPMLPSAAAPSAPATAPPPYWKTLSESLIEMQKVCRENDARMVLVYTPSEGPDGGPVQGGTYYEVGGLCLENGIQFFDPIPALREAAKTNPVYFDLDDHWTRAGHEAVGNAVAERLLKLKLAPDPAEQRPPGD